MVIMFKTPDAGGDAIAEHMKDNPNDDRKAIEAKVAKYVEWGEYVYIDIDLKTGEARVLRNGE